MAPGVNNAIRQLILRKRINATSVMMPAAYLGDGEARALADLNVGEQRAAIGLHVTLTAPFKPMSDGFVPARDGRFLPHPELMRLSVTRRLNPDLLTIEIAYRGQAFEVSRVMPTEDELLEDDSAMIRLASILMARSADRVTIKSDDGGHRVLLSFNH